MAVPDDALRHPSRLRALREASLLDTPPEEAFDRLTRLAARLLDAPLALVNLVDDERQFSKSCFAPPDWPAERDASLSDSFCQHVVMAREPLRIEDAETNPRVSSSAMVTELGVRAYLGVPLSTTEGHVLGTLCVSDFVPRTWSDEHVEMLRDLAASVMTEIELRRDLSESEQRAILIVESIRDYGIMELSPDGRIRAWNTGAEQTTGYAREEALGQHFSFHHPPEDSERGEPERELAEALETGRAERQGWRVRKDGARYWTHEVITRMGRAGQRVGFVQVVQDLTEQRRSEERERERVRERAARAEAEASERRIADILESITDVFITFDREWRITYVNSQAEQLTGARREALVGHSLWAMYPQLRDTPVHEAFQKAMLDRAARDIDYPSRLRPGTWLRFHIAPTSDGLAVYARDITERREAERALQLAREEAEAASRAKSEFLGRMSHELRTPLNAILGFGQLLELEAREDEDQESVEQILKAGRHLLALIDEVLDIVRIEAGRMSFSVEPIALRGVLQESMNLVRHMAAQDRVTLRTQETLASEHFVLGDQQRLRQVLLNLLSNAIKYNRREGAVLLSYEAVTENLLRITVRDTGYGIPAEKLERLFIPFERLGAERSGIQGTGLGLALSKGLVEAMGGRLGIDSVEGEGSTVWVELPLAPRPEEAAPAPGHERPEILSGAAEPTHTVLFVEDNLANVRLVERLFQRRPQMRLLIAMQGSLGLELAREHRPDLILLDLGLPDLSGETVLSRLRGDERTREIPVVILSADAVPGHIRKLLEAGARGYLTKPFDVQQFLELVDGIVLTGEEA